MIRPFLLAAMAFLFPVTAQASDGSHYSSDQGAISGRSPHRTHRPLVQVSNCAKATPNRLRAPYHGRGRGGIVRRPQRELIV